MKVKSLEAKLVEQEKAFEQHERVLKQSFEALMMQLEKERDTLEEVILKLLNGKQETVERHAFELDATMMDYKANTDVVILQTKLKLANEGPSSRDVEGWKDAIFRLTGVHPDEEMAGEEVDSVEQLKNVGATSKDV